MITHNRQNIRDSSGQVSSSLFLLSSTCCTSSVTIRETRSIDFALALKRWNFVAVHVGIPLRGQSLLFSGMLAYNRNIKRSIYFRLSPVSITNSSLLFDAIFNIREIFEKNPSILLDVTDVCGTSSWDFSKNYSGCDFSYVLGQFPGRSRQLIERRVPKVFPSKTMP